MGLSVILDFVANTFPLAREIFALVGIVLSAAVTVIGITSWKGDDKFLENLRKFPILGALLDALIRFSPFSKK